MDENSMDYVNLMDDKFLGFYLWKGRLDVEQVKALGKIGILDFTGIFDLFML